MVRGGCCGIVVLFCCVGVFSGESGVKGVVTGEGGAEWDRVGIGHQFSLFGLDAKAH